jgi:hypothetical protein
MAISGAGGIEMMRERSSNLRTGVMICPNRALFGRDAGE